MSVRDLPPLVLAFTLYNAIILTMGVDSLQWEIFSLHLLSGGNWVFNWGDFILLVTLILLFIEIVKSTFTTTSSTLIDHALSMAVFAVVGAEFLLVARAATSVFFLILVATLIDVIGGYTIGIRMACGFHAEH